MPDIRQRPIKRHTSPEDRTRGALDSDRVLARSTPHSAKSHLVAPAIYYCDTQPTQLDADNAVALGFDICGIPYLPFEVVEDVSSMMAKKNLSVMMDLDITTLKNDSTVVIDHSEWFGGRPNDAKFIHLSEFNQSVSLWNEQISQMQLMGIQAFRCLKIENVPPEIWRFLIQEANKRDPETAFYGWTVGVGTEVIFSIQSCQFDLVFSSSCWWDYKASWLDDETRRLEVIAPVISMATPPNATWSPDPSHRRRALDLAAFYGAGWLMAAGFQNCGEVDLSEHVMWLNRYRRRNWSAQVKPVARVLSSVGAHVAVLGRSNEYILVANTSSGESSIIDFTNLAGRIPGLLHDMDRDESIPAVLEVSAAQSKIFRVSCPPFVTRTDCLEPNCEARRIAIELITPQVDQGQFPVRRVIGERVAVEADLIADGHDQLAAEIVWRCLDEDTWHCAPMNFVENDRWRGTFVVERLGRYNYAVVCWNDIYATYVDELSKKLNAGVSVQLEIREGIDLLQEEAEVSAEAGQAVLAPILRTLENADENTRLTILLSPSTIETMRLVCRRKFEVRSHDIIIDSERISARFASWYEIFPRSQSGDGVRHGTFRDVICQLPRIAAMGFDVLYFPPIHPIGRVNRKGKNNSLTPSVNDPGSPYAIGSQDGGHDAIHPELGDSEDFRALVREAAAVGIAVALDFAIQCAPDHPWLTQHKDWFDWRLDGSLKYAENPPKKYEDIVNVDFYAEGAKPSLWLALRDVIQFWVDKGIRFFRVDNPHTKPLPFWEWLIADIRSRNPDTVFLAEAFTRPKMMYRLAKIGFSQSYTYFTWRNTKAELTAYLTELSETAPRDFFRPHLFVNTPDINPIFLHNSGRAGFLIRAALAATLSGLWGVYNGFEICEATPLAPNREEYLDSEKYQIRVWDYERPGNIVSEIAKLNAIRRSNAALQSHLGIRFHKAFDEQILFFSKTADDGNVVLAVISLDPFNTRQFGIELPLWLFNLSDDASLSATDLMRDFEFTWLGKNQDVTLHPDSPFCIWRVRPLGD